MIKELMRILGGIGNVIFYLLFLWLFYVSPGWPKSNMDADSKGWGSLFYSLMFVPILALVFLVYSFISLKSGNVPGRYISYFMASYAVLVVIVEILGFKYIDVEKASGSVAIGTFIINLLFLISIYFIKAKFA